MQNETSENDEGSASAVISLVNRLQAFDKCLSRPFFQAKLPAVLEYVCSVPGNFFGVPLFTMIVTPNLNAAFFASKFPPTWWCLLVALPLLAVLALWTFVLKGHLWAIRIFYGPTLGALSPLGGVALLMLLPDEETEARQVAQFQIAAWSAAVIPVAILKPLVARCRPCYGDGGCDASEKHLSVLPLLFRRDGRASFPSGDTAGAMAVAYPLIRCGSDGMLMFGLACVTLSCMGRMYWKAHHLGDVLAGVGLAWGACRVLEELTRQAESCSCCATLKQAGLSHLTLLVTVIVFRIISKKKVFESGTISTHESKKL